MPITRPTAKNRLLGMWAKPVVRCWLIFLILGYTIYYVARALDTAPMWAVALIDALKPWLGTLNTIEHVSHDPFAVQCLLVYCALSVIPLTIYPAIWMLTDKRYNDYFVTLHRTRATKRISFLFVSVVAILLSLLLLVSVFGRDTMNPSWRTIAAFTPGLFGVSLNLLSTAGFSWLLSTAPTALKYALYGLPPVKIPSDDGTDQTQSVDDSTSA